MSRRLRFFCIVQAAIACVGFVVLGRLTGHDMELFSYTLIGSGVGMLWGSAVTVLAWRYWQR